MLYFTFKSAFSVSTSSAFDDSLLRICVSSEETRSHLHGAEVPLSVFHSLNRREVSDIPVTIEYFRRIYGQIKRSVIRDLPHWFVDRLPLWEFSQRDPHKIFYMIELFNLPIHAMMASSEKGSSKYQVESKVG